MTNPLHPLPSRRYLRHGMLPQLAAFEAVVRLGSVTRAAEALCIAQPTLSGHLRKLSEALGVRLFDLQGKRPVPTPAALVLLEAGLEVFAALARCERELASLPAVSRVSAFESELPRAVAGSVGLSHSAWNNAPKRCEPSLLRSQVQPAMGQYSIGAMSWLGNYRP